MKRLPRIFLWIILVSVLLAGIAWWAVPEYRGDLSKYHGVQKITDREGRTLRVSLGPDELYCVPVPLSEMGEWTAEALIAFEDKRFKTHCGIDLIAMSRAFGRNLRHRRITSGASTLTTLVIKMTEPRSRNLWTKWVEAHHALGLERTHSKDEIIAQYLNRAPFGGNVHGIEAASQRYFGKPARNLSLAESALLVGLPQLPSKLRPDRYPDRAFLRRDRVLGNMLTNEIITEKQFQTAAKQRMKITTKPVPFIAPHFCDIILQRDPSETFFTTTLDFKIQQMAEAALEARVAELAPRGVQSGAVVVADVKTGEVLALVGSVDFWESQVNGATARRSPGSTLKPFAYAEAIERGAATPATRWADIPTRFSDYLPENYSRAFSGPVSLRRALTESLNIPALRCIRQIGMDPFIEQLRELGIQTLDRSASDYGLGIAVGSCETTLLNLVEAYGCLARGGTHLPLQFMLNHPEAAPHPIYSAETAFLIADILGGEERTQELMGHRAEVFLPRVAWKTGTSSGYRDAWTLAYNPDYIVGVWMGNPDGAASDALIGGSAAAPVAGEIFRALYPSGHSPWFEKPDGLSIRSVCAESGDLPNPHCRTVENDYYIPQISPSKRCTVHQANGIVWPQEIQTFLETRGMAADDGAKKSLRILSPAPDATYRLLPPSQGMDQTIALTATTPDAYWFIDGKRYTAPRWKLKKGTHTIACADAHGATAQLQIHVE